VSKYLLAPIAFSVILLCVGITATSRAQDITTQNQAVTGVDQLYTHSEKGFQVLVPGDAILVDGEAGMDASIRSRKGWGVNIQSAVANPQTGVDEMLGRLESKYLGSDKTWTQKLSGMNIMAFGRPGYDGAYAGSGMKARVVLLRTADLDFVLMFIAPENAYMSAQATFDRILSSFKPATVEGVPQLTQPPVVEAQGGTDLIRFHDTELGYSMVSPGNWKIGRPNQSTTVFSGPPGTEAAYAAVTVQNVAPPATGTARLSVDAVLQELRAQMAYSLSNIRHVSGQPFTLPSTSGPIQVVQFVSDYRRGDVDFRQWTLAMPRPGGDIVHVWTYIAPLDRFATFQALAEQMAGSWTVVSTSP
jgi:hypothetical protein